MKYLDKNSLIRFWNGIKAKIPTKTSQLTNDSNYINNNDSRLSDARTPKSHATSATTYGVGTSGNYGHCKIINHLTQTSNINGYALSAYQGYLLNERLKKVEEKLQHVSASSTEMTIADVPVYHGSTGKQFVTDDGK